MAAQLSYWDYVKAAFRQRVKIGFLGHVPINKLAVFTLAVLGVLNPGFWLLGAAAEIVYLVGVAGNGRYQKLVQGEALMKEKAGGEQKIQQTVTLLTPPSAERYRRLVEQCRAILGLNAPSKSSNSLEDMRAGSLNQLLWLFLRLLSSRETLLSTLSQVDKKSLETDVERLREKLSKAEANSPLARSVQATLDIESKRLENLGKAKSSLEVIEAELERIEQQVRLIREESAVSGGPDFLSARLDAVTSTLSETTKWMDQHAELISTLSGDDVAAGPPGIQISPPALTATPPSAPPPPPRQKQRQ
jgi:hypothetical protein